MDIIWTKEAEEGLSNIVNYINQKFGEVESQKYLKQIFKSIERLRDFSYAQPISQKTKGVRKMVFKKKTIILYVISNEAIYIATVFDHRKC